MRATIDRIEGALAVLISREDESLRINLPVSLLPPGCCEGDIITIGIERDTRATTDAKKRVSDRIEKLKHRR